MPCYYPPPKSIPSDFCEGWIQKPGPKLRGVKRRIRALQRWQDGFIDGFPSEQEISQCERYWNWKIPTHYLLVEGRQSTLETKRAVAQVLIDTCSNLANCKPGWARDIRITCKIPLPDMFSSEICLYTSEEYFQSHMECGEFEDNLRISTIDGPKLSERWELKIPKGFSEVGLKIDFPGYEAGVDAHEGELWFFGEVST
jgi:hypothetical protein